MMRGRSGNSVVAKAEQVVRNYRLSQGEEGEEGGILIPTWLFFLGLGLSIGIVTGPAIMGMTETGALRLREIAESKLRK
jgi:hypothetical protein